MKKLVAATALALCLPLEADAQPTDCARIAVGAAGALLRESIPVDPELAGGGRFGLATARRVGFEGSVHASFPLVRNWVVLTEFGAGSRDVRLERDASGAEVQHKTGHPLTQRRLNVGLVRYRPIRAGCTYWSFRAGRYLFGYAGVTLAAPGGAAAMGSQLPVSESAAIFFEVELYLALTQARPPVTPASALANIRPALGFRYRF
jgi:hypothetical protein